MLKLYPPRKGSTSYRIRGTHGFAERRCRVDISARTHERRKAEAHLREVETKIDAGTWGDSPQSGASFAAAAMSYVQTGGSKRYVEALVLHFGETPWREIDQASIDRAATTLRPRASAATRNRCVYTPMAAILRHKDPAIHIRRPPGARGVPRTDYLNPDDAMAIIEAAEGIDGEFGSLLRFLLYSGSRLGEALGLDWSDVHNGTAYIRTSKNDDPRTVRLRTDVDCEMEARRKPTGPVFPFHYGGHLKEMLKRATCLASGVEWRTEGLAAVGERVEKGQSAPHALSLQEGPATPNTASTDRLSSLRNRDVGYVAKPEQVPEQANAHRPRLSREPRWYVPPHRLRWVNFHTFRHTWATYMRRYGGADVEALVATGNWRDRRSAARYSHVHAHEVWEAVELFPSMKRGEG